MEVHIERNLDENPNIRFPKSLFPELSKKPWNLPSVFPFIFGWTKLALIFGEQVFKNSVFLLLHFIPNLKIACLWWMNTTSRTSQILPKWWYFGFFCLTYLIIPKTGLELNFPLHLADDRQIYLKVLWWAGEIGMLVCLKLRIGFSFGLP